MHDAISGKIKTAIKERTGVNPRTFGENGGIAYTYEGIAGDTRVYVFDYNPDSCPEVDADGKRGGIGIIVVQHGTTVEDYPTRFFDSVLDVEQLIDYLVDTHATTRQPAAA